MNPLYKEIIGTWIRAALTFVSALLIQHHVVTAKQGEALVAMLFDQSINALPAIGALAWSWWQKHTSRKVLLTALTLPPGATENDAKAIVKSGEATPAVSTPPNTAPGVPKIDTLLLLSLMAAVLIGCSSTPVQVKAGSDPVVVNAEWLAENGTAMLDNFVAFERKNEAVLKAKFPDAHGMADLVRDDVVDVEINGKKVKVPASILKLRTITKQYQADKTDPNKQKLAADSEALLNLINEVRGYMELPPITLLETSPSVMDLMKNSPTNAPN